MSTTLITRETAGGGATVKDAPLTNAEIDSNFISLAENKLEASSNLADLTDTTAAKANDHSCRFSHGCSKRWNCC